ncbi:MAG: patatin-like phospholipase family protein [Gammaproteobacteria bacterium]|nr:patatin-like phospholipase family protein [Gammaproteobacteria bacterium]
MLRLIFLVCIFIPLVTEARPRVGLVLSGGGARGAAHIGVLKYLEERQIPIDIITGTSMGAIVGGLYASGIPVGEIERITTEMDWTRKLIDDVPRQERSIQRKRLDDLFSIEASPGFEKGEIKIPSGAIQGQNIILELQRITQHVSHIDDFSRLPIPFSAVASDIVTGEVVLLDHGDLAIAMRASMGVPALFAPIVVEGRLLMDGGVTNNVPIDIARDMGADILIVVDIAAPLLDAANISNLITITDQLTRLLINTNSMEQLKTLGEQDILLKPQLGEFSSLAFDQAAVAIAIGYEAATDHGLSLQKFQVPKDLYERPVRPEVREKRISNVTLDNKSGLKDEVIKHIVETSVGDSLDLDKLEGELTKVYGLGNFEHVGYGLTHHNGGVDLRVTTTAKSWGPNYLHFGIAAESGFEHDSQATLLLGYTREEMSDIGAHWTSFIGVGDEPIIQTMWYQPLTYRHDWYFFSTLGISDEVLSEFVDDEKVAEFGLRRVSGFIGIGYEFESLANIQVGINRISGTTDLSIGDPETKESDFEDGNVSLLFLYDTRNDIDFPSSGSVFDVTIRSSMKELGADENYQQWELNAARYFARGLHNFGVALNIGGTNGRSNVGSIYRLGGYGRLTGIRHDQLKGNYKGIFSAVYYHRYQRIPVADGFIGAIVEYGGAWSDRKDIASSDSIFSAGAFIGADTPIGTLQIGIAFSDKGDVTGFSRIGRAF